MFDMRNKLARNRKSPKNEKQLAYAYKQVNKSANKKNDGFDVSMVTAKDGTKGIGLMPEQFNRSRTKDFRRVRGFISEAELKNIISKKSSG